MNRLSVSVISNTSIADGVVQVDINDLTAKGQCCVEEIWVVLTLCKGLSIISMILFSGFEFLQLSLFFHQKVLRKVLYIPGCTCTCTCTMCM